MDPSKRQKVDTEATCDLPPMIKIFKNAMQGKADRKDLPVYGTFDKPIFLAETVGDMVGADSAAMNKLLRSWGDIRYAFKMRVSNPTATGKQRITHDKWALTDAGLTRFAFSARSADSANFRDWICLDVVPSIRKTGEYKVEDKTAIEELNEKLKKTLTETKQQNETIVQRLSDNIQEMQSKISDANIKLKAKEDEIQGLNGDSERAKVLQIEVQDLQHDIDTMRNEYDNVVNNFDIVSDHLRVCVGSSDLTTILSNSAMAPPMVNRNQLIFLRCSAFNVLHTISYMLVRGFIESTARYMTCVEMSNAIHAIMEVADVIVPEKACKNWITLYCILAKLAKARLDDDVEYSTEMPLSHIYLYTRNINTKKCFT